MRRATENDKALIVEILSESFIENKSVLFIVNNDKTKIPKLMAYSFEMGLRFGEVWLNDKDTATIIALYPRRKKFSFASIIQDIKLLFQVIGTARLFKVIKREKAIKAKQPKSDFIHLWYIGVLNSDQNKGVGTTLLKDFVELKKKENLPIYLETSTYRNINFYKKNGFQRIGEISDQLPYTLYLFVKTP